MKNGQKFPKVEAYFSALHWDHSALSKNAVVQFGIELFLV